MHQVSLYSLFYCQGSGACDLTDWTRVVQAKYPDRKIYSCSDGLGLEALWIGALHPLSNLNSVPAVTVGCGSWSKIAVACVALEGQGLWCRSAWNWTLWHLIWYLVACTVSEDSPTGKWYCSTHWQAHEGRGSQSIVISCSSSMSSAFCIIATELNITCSKIWMIVW